MTSPALEAWRSSRLARLDRLLAAHPDAPGSTTDPAVAEEWTQALVLRLAAEFQGFCRDLHDSMVKQIVEAVTVPGSRLGSVLYKGLIIGRGLDQRSADPKTLSADFARLGVNLWAVLGVDTPEAVTAWRDALRLLHRARNGVVHDDHQARAEVQAEGWPMHLDSIRRWRNALDEIAVAMECMSSQDMADLFVENRNSEGV